MRQRVATICGFLLVGAVFVSGCGSDGGGGERSLNDQLQEARAVEDPAQRTDALIEVAKKYVKAADTMGARDCLRDGTKAAEEISVEEQAAERAQAYINLAEGWLAAGDKRSCEDAYEAAEDALDHVDDATTKTERLIDLALLKIKVDDKSDAARDLKSAEERTAEIADSFVRVEMLGWVAYGHNQMDDKDEAGRVMNSAKTLAESQEAPGDKARLLSLVGREQISSLGDQEAGLATLAAAADIARSIQDNAYLQASVLVGVAHDYLKADQKDKTRELLNEAQEICEGRSECKPVMGKIEEVRGKL
ncbi:MAG: hypothetical protein OES79_09575 [Planctomycetota bacterium]|nr:hypothetical protein [Planctomycetota bacterium]